MKFVRRGVMRRAWVILTLCGTLTGFVVIYKDIIRLSTNKAGERSEGIARKEVSSNMSKQDIVVYDASSNKPKSKLEDMTKEDRLAFVEQRCSASKSWFKDVDKVIRQQWFFVDNKHQLMVCIGAKVASHQIVGILQTINKLTGNLWKYRSKITRYLSVDEANTSPHTKVMFVREPLERLLSAYIDKDKGKNVSFVDFLKRILRTPIEQLNIHHQIFNNRCQPCKIHYQYIGTLATFQNDIKQTFNSSDFKRTDNHEPTQRVAVDNLQNYFKDVDPELVHQLWEKFRIDYELFGFPYPSHLTDRV